MLAIPKERVKALLHIAGCAFAHVENIGQLIALYLRRDENFEKTRNERKLYDLEILSLKREIAQTIRNAQQQRYH